MGSEQTNVNQQRRRVERVVKELADRDPAALEKWLTDAERLVENRRRRSRRS